MDIVALIELLVNGLIEAEESFLSNPRDLYSLEKATKATTDAVATQFISEVLSSMDKAIYNSSIRKYRYNAQRTRQRTLISSVGDLSFDCTLYRRKGSKNGGYVHSCRKCVLFPRAPTRRTNSGYKKPETYVGSPVFRCPLCGGGGRYFL